MLSGHASKDFGAARTAGGSSAPAGRRAPAIFLSVLALGFAAATSANAQGTITNGAYSVGIGPNGELYNKNQTVTPEPPVNPFSTGLGIRRNSDGYDPLRPFTPRDTWGISINSSNIVTRNAAFADQTSFIGSANILSTVSSFTVGTANYTTTTSLGLTVNQVFSFAAANILKIDVTVKNTSLAEIDDILFQRVIDWDIYPTLRKENSFGGTSGEPYIKDMTYKGIENAKPYIAYGFSCDPDCNHFGDEGASHLSDDGGGIKLGFGDLNAGDFVKVSYFYGINNSGQSVNSLINEATSVGADAGVVSQSTEDNVIADLENNSGLGDNSAFIAVGNFERSVPAPLLATGLPGGVAMGMIYWLASRRRRQNLVAAA
jgi:hypothetical protein